MAPNMRTLMDERTDGAACSRGHRRRRWRVCGSQRHWVHGYGRRVARDRDRQGGANPAAGPARADLGHACERDSARQGIGAGSPCCVDGRVDDAAWGSRGRYGMPRVELVSPTIEEHRASEKQFWAAAGFAPAQPVGKHSRFVGRRDGNIGAARPKRARLDEGKRQLPSALARPGDESSSAPTDTGRTWWAAYWGTFA